MSAEAATLEHLTRGWGSSEAVNLYLDRCQVGTPEPLVRTVWGHVWQRRRTVRKVVDFGAGDGRFARPGRFHQYVGYEIDPGVCRAAGGELPSEARLVNRCAFSETITDADLCIGNPPYVRNQDLPPGWRQRAADILHARLGVEVSGLANAWQYFALLALASTKPDGLVALVIPYEWVSRPSARSLREYVKSHEWDVETYRLRDCTFDRVLTTSSITIIDKRSRRSQWAYFEEGADGRYRPLVTASGSRRVLSYAERVATQTADVTVRRGLSPGTQHVLTLTEGERVRAGLKVDGDVLRCVTTLRPLAADALSLTPTIFRRFYVEAGRKCWLVRTDRVPSTRLKAYLDSVPPEDYATATCLERETWWKFTMPERPALFVATGFRGQRPKAVVNGVKAVAVGSVSGIYGPSTMRAFALVRVLMTANVSTGVVAHSKGLKKLESGQLHTLVHQLLGRIS